MDDATLIDELLGVQADPQRAARGRQQEIPIDATGRVVKREVRRRVFHRKDRTQNAIECLVELPGPDETHHYLMPGSFDSFDLVDAILERAKPATITTLLLASLGFNQSNAERLVEMLDRGQVGRCCLIVSTYYNADPKEQAVCYRLRQELPERGDGWYCVTRSHCKIIAAALTDGRHIVIESSANMRSCRNLEQFCISQDRQLFQFHQSWMEDCHHAENERLARLADG